MKMTKREILGSIHELLVHNYGHEIGGVMFLYMMQKCQGLNYGDANKMLKQDLVFLKNLTKTKPAVMDDFLRSHSVYYGQHA
jgi:hypothetical protein